MYAREIADCEETSLTNSIKEAKLPFYISGLKPLILPFTLVTVCGVVVGVVWLAILGKWSVLGNGLFLILGSVPVLMLARSPEIVIGLCARPFLQRRRWSCGFLLLWLGMLYSDAIVSVWCLTVVVFFVKAAGINATLPALLLAYGVTISPLLYMTSMDKAAGPAFLQEVSMTCGAVVSVVLMAMVILSDGTDIRELLYACAVPMTVVSFTHSRISNAIVARLRG